MNKKNKKKQNLLNLISAFSDMAYILCWIWFIIFAAEHSYILSLLIILILWATKYTNLTYLGYMFEEEI